jgi:hypothetical protein
LLLRSRRRVIALGLLVPLAMLPACSGKKKAPSASTGAATAAGTPTGSVSAAPSPTAALAQIKVAPGHPFTGLDAPIGPVVAIKVNNTAAGMPQTGLGQADLIYQELAEGGETRLCAIYSTKRPPLVGPIRSVRETDIELLAEYGKIGLAFSGANKLMLRVVRRANLVDARWDAVPAAYTELHSRHQPYRVHASVAKLIELAKGADAKDIGMRFGASRSPSSAARTVTIRWERMTNTVRYNPTTRRWTVYFNNRAQVTVDNLVVQYVKIKQTGFTDAAGSHVPLARTLGSGKLMVFRDGQAIAGSWHRRFMANPTVMLDSKSRHLFLHRGTTFFMLVPNTMTISVA